MPAGFFEGYSKGIEPATALAMKAMELKRSEDALSLQTKLATQKHGLELMKFSQDIEKEQTERTLKALTAGKERAISTGDQTAFNALMQKENELLGLDQGFGKASPALPPDFVGPPGPPVFPMPMSKFDEQKALKIFEAQTREPKLYDTAKGWLPTNQAQGEMKPQKNSILRMNPVTGEVEMIEGTGVAGDIAGKGLQNLNKEMGKDILKQRSDAMGATIGLQSLYQAKKILNSGIITGTGAEFLTNMGNLLSSRLGYKKFEDPVANTQAFAATMGTQVGQIIKQFGAGTGLSDADREYAEKIVGGRITLSEQAIRKLFDINERAYKNVIKNYNKIASDVKKKPGSENLLFSLDVEMPSDTDDPLGIR